MYPLSLLLPCEDTVSLTLPPRRGFSLELDMLHPDLILQTYRTVKNKCLIFTSPSVYGTLL